MWPKILQNGTRFPSSIIYSVIEKQKYIETLDVSRKKKDRWDSFLTTLVDMDKVKMLGSPNQSQQSSHLPNVTSLLANWVNYKVEPIVDNESSTNCDWAWRWISSTNNSYKVYVFTIFRSFFVSRLLKFTPSFYQQIRTFYISARTSDSATKRKFKRKICFNKCFDLFLLFC